jgi:hypothetical protein
MVAIPLLMIPAASAAKIAAFAAAHRAIRPRARRIVWVSGVHAPVLARSILPLSYRRGQSQIGEPIEQPHPIAVAAARAGWRIIQQPVAAPDECR